MTQRFLCWLFAIVYRRWLWNPYYKNHDRVLRVKGWRTALVITGSLPFPHGQRRTMTACFWRFQ